MSGDPPTRETPETVFALIVDYFKARGQTRSDAVRFCDNANLQTFWPGITDPELRTLAERWYVARHRRVSRR